MPIWDGFTFDFVSRSTDQTRRLGIRLGAMIKAGDLLCLEGNLGAGKTTFVQGLAQGWGSLNRVTSPTFVLVNVYQRGDLSSLFHLDAYRLDSLPEAEDLDLVTMLETGGLVVEWAEKIDPLLPQERIWIRFEWLQEEHRRLTFRCKGTRYQHILQEFRQRVFAN